MISIFGVYEDNGECDEQIEIRDIPPSASREGCFHYVASELLNYWLAPGLFEVNNAGDLRQPVQAVEIMDHLLAA
ncbi:MAG: hypothetical protein EBR92_08095 [Alphaproteobacteria bacterium]|nr:hypothetical protein [Alphaproteobacteria bacterium]